MAKKKNKSKKTKNKKLKIPKLKLFQALTVVLAVALIGSFLMNGTTGCLVAGSPEAVGENTIGYINTNLLPPGTEAQLAGAIEEEGLYKVTLDLEGQQTDAYVGPQGKRLFPTSIDMSEKIEQPQQQPQQDTQTAEDFDAPDAQEPEAQLFVMSFCPYGMPAEESLKPIFELLGDKADIKPQFIVSVEGDSVQSLHGDYEVEENMRQACIVKEYGNEMFWDYVVEFNSECTKDNLDTCWKEQANAVGVDTAKIESCVESKGLELMKEEAAITEELGITGSPTLVVNGEIYMGARDSDSFKTAICSGFAEPPAECEQVVEGTATVDSSVQC